VGFFSATFFCARKNASHFSSSGAKKRHIQPERYAKYKPENIVEKNILKMGIDKILLIKYTYQKEYL